MTEPTGRHLELYLREETRGLAGRRQAAVQRRVEELAATPAVDTVEIIEWPRKLAIDGPGPTDERTETVFHTFCAWARENDARLYPAFGTRSCYAWDTGLPYTALVLPIMALAVYDEDELEAVYPFTEDGTYHTVFDGLAALEVDDRSLPSEERPPVLAE